MPINHNHYKGHALLPYAPCTYTVPVCFHLLLVLVFDVVCTCLLHANLVSDAESIKKENKQTNNQKKNKTNIVSGPSVLFGLKV